MKTYKARVRLSGRTIEVQVQARGSLDAKALLEAQYGKGSVVFGPIEAR